MGPFEEESSQAKKPEPDKEIPEKAEMPALRPVPFQPLSFEELVGRLEELVLFALECEKRELKEGVSFVNVYKQLMNLRKAIDILAEDQKEAFEVMQDMAKERGIQIQPNQASLSDKDKKVLEKLRSLQEICEAARGRLYESMKENPEEERALEEKIQEATTSEEKRAKRRKGKFRRLGSKEGWIPT
jgi:hypothetical protein